MLTGEERNLSTTRRRLRVGWWLTLAESVGTGLTFSFSLLALSLHTVALLWFAVVPAILTIALFLLDLIYIFPVSKKSTDG